MLDRMLRSLIWFGVGVALVAVPMLAKAETCTETVCTTPATYDSSSFQWSLASTLVAPFFASPDAGCQYRDETWWANNPSMTTNYQPYAYLLTLLNASTGYYSCAVRYQSKTTSAVTTANTYYLYRKTGAYICPAGEGYTLSGTTCTRPACPAGYDRGFDGVCIPPPDPCPQGNKSSATAFSGYYGIGNGKVTGNGAGVNVGGTYCDGTCSGIPSGAGSTSCVSQYDSGSSADPQPIYCTFEIELTGAKCTGGNGTAPGYCPSGQTIIGSANGLPVCGKDGVPSDESKPTTSGEETGTDTKTETDTDGDGTPDTTETGSERTGRTTTCVGETCTTTTTKTTTNPDGTTTETTTTTTESKDSFCTTHPTDAQCADEPINGGTAAGVEGLYSKVENRTVSDVVGAFSTKVQSAGFFAAASNFFDVQVPSGSCGGLSDSFTVLGQSFYIDLDSVFCGSTAQSVFSLLGIGVMLAALWVAFAIALL